MILYSKIRIIYFFFNRNNRLGSSIRHATNDATPIRRDLIKGLVYYFNLSIVSWHFRRYIRISYHFESSGIVSGVLPGIHICCISLGNFGKIPLPVLFRTRLAPRRARRGQPLLASSAFKKGKAFQGVIRWTEIEVVVATLHWGSSHEVGYSCCLADTVYNCVADVCS